MSSKPIELHIVSGSHLVGSHTHTLTSNDFAWAFNVTRGYNEHEKEKFFNSISLADEKKTPVRFNRLIVPSDNRVQIEPQSGYVDEVRYFLNYPIHRKVVWYYNWITAIDAVLDLLLPPIAKVIKYIALAILKTCHPAIQRRADGSYNVFAKKHIREVSFLLRGGTLSVLEYNGTRKNRQIHKMLLIPLPAMNTVDNERGMVDIGMRFVDKKHKFFSIDAQCGHTGTQLSHAYHLELIAISPSMTEFNSDSTPAGNYDGIIFKKESKLLAHQAMQFTGNVSGMWYMYAINRTPSIGGQLSVKLTDLI